MPQQTLVRLQKVLAAAGHGSRRACEALIQQGDVLVNKRRVDQLPCLVDPINDLVEIRGERVQHERPVYLMLHKPRGVVCTNRDPDGRKRVIDLLPNVRERVFPVGRLDTDSAGLLLITNDGELANRLTHPRYEVPKMYVAVVDGYLTDDDLARLERGVWGSDGRMKASRVQIVGRNKTRSVLEITLQEGRNRQIRRMLAALGHKVRTLSRVRIGEIWLKGVGPGKFRPLGPHELAYLRRITGLPLGRGEGKAAAASAKPATGSRKAGTVKRSSVRARAAEDAVITDAESDAESAIAIHSEGDDE